MTPEEYRVVVAEQPETYSNKLAYMMEKASCMAAVSFLHAEFLNNPSAHNWNPLLEAMARYQNVVRNCTWEE